MSTSLLNSCANRSQCRSSDTRSRCLSCSGKPLRLSTTVSTPAKYFARFRKLSRTILLTRFRSTARFIFFLAIAIPSRPCSRWLRRQRIVKKLSTDRPGRLNTLLYDSASCNRQQRGKPACFWNKSNRYRGQSGRQTSSALCAACVDHLATSAGRHARTKAVSTGAFEDAGLECSFHGNVPG